MVRPSVSRRPVRYSIPREAAAIAASSVNGADDEDELETGVEGVASTREDEEDGVMGVSGVGVTSTDLGVGAGVLGDDRSDDGWNSVWDW